VREGEGIRHRDGAIEGTPPHHQWLEDEIPHEVPVGPAGDGLGNMPDEAQACVAIKKDGAGRRDQFIPLDHLAHKPPHLLVPRGAELAAAGGKSRGEGE